jgi:inosine-uridine nucleoside N-ribohydrolase
MVGRKYYFYLFFYFYFILLIFGKNKKIPIIIDTDIGTDIDDTWAISYLLQISEIEIKLILTESHNTLARTKVLAKFLHLIGREDIAIGIGYQQDNLTGPEYGALYSWANDFELSKYKGIIYKNGIEAFIETINNSSEEIIILVIAPCLNIQKALQLNASIVKKSRIIAMGGSICIGYNGKSPKVPEYNIVDNIIASQSMYDTKWNIISFPLDVTIFAQIEGKFFHDILNSKNKITQLLISNYKYWLDNCSWSNQSGLKPPNLFNRSSSLHDLVSASFIPMHWNQSSSYWIFDNLSISINSTGFTNINKKNGKIIQESLSWKNIQHWFEFMTAIFK